MDHPSELSGFGVTWLGQQGEVRVPLADAASTAFEDAPPVRDFPSYQGQRHFPGLYYSVTSDRHVGYESWLERDHAMLLDFDPLITGFASQPFLLFWTQGRQGRTHAPDFFARRADGIGVVVDGLTTGSSRATWRRSRPLSMHARRWAGSIGGSVKSSSHG